MNSSDGELRENFPTTLDPRKEHEFRLELEYRHRKLCVVAWVFAAVVSLAVIYGLGIHLLETRKHIATEQTRAEIARSGYSRQVVGRDSAGTSSGITAAGSFATKEAASIVTMQGAVEHLYSIESKTRSTLPVDSIISIVQQFLDWGAIPKDTATSLINELKDFAKPIAIEGVKALLARYFGGQSIDAGTRPGLDGGLRYGASTLVCNSFNTSPTRTVLTPAPPKPKPTKTKPVADPSCSTPPTSQTQN